MPLMFVLITKQTSTATQGHGLYGHVLASAAVLPAEQICAS